MRRQHKLGRSNRRRAGNANSDPLAPAAPRHGEAGAGGEGRPVSILFVEHSSADVELCLRTLRRAGLAPRVDLAPTPEEFAARLAGGAYDLVLADYRLPKWTGMDALRMLRESGRQLPFILVTGSLGEVAAVDCIKQGVTDYVLKDRLARLPLAIERALDEQQRRTERHRAEEDRARLADILEATVDFVGTADVEGRVLYINRAGRRIVGLGDDADVLSTTIRDYHPEGAAQKIFAEGIPAAMRAGSWQGETALRTRDGREIPVAQLLLVHRDPSGQVRFLSTICRDISERIAAERERQRLLRDLGERVKELTVLHRTARLLQSPVAASPADLLPQVAALLPPGFQFPGIAVARVRFAGRSYVSTAPPWPAAAPPHLLAAEAPTSDGQALRIEVGYLEDPPGLSGPVFLAEEQTLLESLAEMLRAHFDRARAVEALRASEEKFARAFRSSPDAVAINALADARYLDVNESFLRQSGYPREEVLGRTPEELGLWVDRAQQEEFRRRLREAGAVENLEAEFRARGGERRVALVSAERIEVAGQPAVLSIARDITERRALERQLQTAQKFEAIGQLAGGIAHDFNNVLGAILGWAELALAELPADHPLRNHLERIRDQGERAADLTRQLLAFARRQILAPRNIDLNDAVRQGLRLLEKVIGSDIEMRLDLAPDLLPARADPTQVEQVLMNLCLNARDAMPRGGVLLVKTRNASLGEEYVRRHPHVRPGEFVLLEVTDDGEGMGLATLDRIFEPFFTTKEQGQGTGLGLATVYGIVKQHGGFIHVYSEPGQGTTLRVYLPVGEGAAEPRLRPPAQPVRGGTETVLLAEDHEGLRELASATLERLGYRVLVAGDGVEAVELFAAHRDQVALALLDIVLPRLSGPDAYAQMLERAPALPALFMTGYSTEAPMLSALLKKPTPLLQKPYTPERLARAVRDALDRRHHPIGVKRLYRRLPAGDSARGTV